jgi:aminoglycoside phosphotransferase
MSDLGSLPDEVAELIAGGDVMPVTIGLSAAGVYRVERADGPWFVKVQRRRDDLETSLLDEGARMRWLADHVPVPTVLAAGHDAEVEWLVTSALPGSDATRPEHQGDAARLVALLGEGLRRFHDEVPAAGCPFDASTTVLVEQARARVAAGRVDHTEFGSIHQGVSAEELHRHLIETVPADVGDLVVTHGDFCVPNVIVDRGQLSGYVDLGRAGVGDRYRDLGVGARSIAHNFGGHAVGPFLDAYGLDWPELARLDFFVMLDEFF